MHAFLSSFFSVVFAEIGDKTQLLTLFLTARFCKKYAIIAGMFFATLLNHAVSAWLGVTLTKWLTPDLMMWIVGLSFIIVGLWLLKPDKEDELSRKYMGYGAFLTTFILFFIAEIGDKTQIATILLAARYDAMLPVILGSIAALLVADVPVIYFGEWVMKKLPFKKIRYGACFLFCLLGILTLVGLWS